MEVKRNHKSNMLALSANGNFWPHYRHYESFINSLANYCILWFVNHFPQWNWSPDTPRNKTNVWANVSLKTTCRCLVLWAIRTSLVKKFMNPLKWIIASFEIIVKNNSKQLSLNMSQLPTKKKNICSFLRSNFDHHDYGFHNSRYILLKKLSSTLSTCTRTITHKKKTPDSETENSY